MIPGHHKASVNSHHSRLFLRKTFKSPKSNEIKRKLISTQNIRSEVRNDEGSLGKTLNGVESKSQFRILQLLPRKRRIDL